MSDHRNLKRTDLFLIRMWTTEERDVSGGSEKSGTEWRGKVQRVVDGESHQFDGWQGLADLLAEMLSKSSGARLRTPSSGKQR
jgi:hypothetical protein